MKNPRGLFHQSWKDAMEIYIKPPIAMVEVQGYYYKAFLETGWLAHKVMHDNRLKKLLDKKAESLKRVFNEKFWMKDENYFAMALSRRKKQMRIIASNPGHLLFTGIIGGPRARKVVKRLFKKDMFTLYGIRTESEESQFFNPTSYHHGSIWPHDNWIIYMGLKEMGFKEEAEKIKSAIFLAQARLNHIPELYTVIDNKLCPLKRSCTLQAWATGALIDMLLN
jgi:glycogen debranching enzyme